jgi:hypothetical protein
MSVVMCLKVPAGLAAPESWMPLQAAYNLKKAAHNKKVMERVAKDSAGEAGPESSRLSLYTSKVVVPETPILAYTCDMGVS